MVKLFKKVITEKGFLRYLKNTSWLMGEKVFRLLLALTVGVLVTKYLGPERLGVLSYAQSFVGLFAAFSSMGLHDILVRELLQSKNEHNKLIGTAFWLQILGSTFIMACLLLFIYLSDNDAQTNQIILILGFITFIQSFNVISDYFSSQVKSKYATIPAFIGIIISAILKLIGIWQQAPLLYFVYVLIFDVLFLILGQIYYYRKDNFKISNWTFKWGTAKKLLKDAWPLILSTIVISIYMKIDQVMIKDLIDTEAVGQYAAAVRLSEAWYFIPMVICSSLFPAILNAKSADTQLYKKRLANLYDLMVVLGLSIVIPVLLFADWGILLLYGAEFNQTAGVLKIHIWAGVFVFLGVANQKWFISENLQAYNIICLGLGMLVNIGLNLFWIPTYGIAGAAFATLCSQFCASVFAPLLFKKTRSSFFMMLKSLLFINLIKKIKL